MSILFPDCEITMTYEAKRKTGVREQFILIYENISFRIIRRGIKNEKSKKSGRNTLFANIMAEGSVIGYHDKRPLDLVYTGS